MGERASGRVSPSRRGAQPGVIGQDTPSPAPESPPPPLPRSLAPESPVLALAPSPAREPWLLVLFAIWLAWLSNFMVRSALAPGLPGIRADFQLSYGEGGLLATGFLIGYTSMMLPGGLIGDRLGRRRMVLLASLGWTTSAVLIGLSPSFAVLLACMFGLGMVMGSFNGNDRAIVSTFTPADKMGLGQGLSYTGLGIGNGLGVMLAGIMAAAWSWRVGFIAFAAVSMLAVAALWRFVPEPPRAPSVPIRRVAGQVFGNRDLWLLYIGGMPSVAVAWLLITWAPTILLETTRLDLGTASLFVSGVGFAAVPALAGMGVASDYVVRRGGGRKGLVAAGHAVLALMLVLLATSIDQRWGAIPIAVLMLVVSLAQWSPWAAAYALLADIVPRSAMGMAFGLGATMWSLGAVSAPWLAGFARDLSGSFTSAFYVLAGLALLGALLSAAVRPAFRFGPERRLEE